MMTCSRPVFWLSSSPSISVVLAMPGCPFTSKRSESCELKNCECSRCGRLTPGTVCISDWKLRLKVRGSSRHHLGLDDAAGVGAIGLQHGRFSRDRDRLRQLTDFELQVDADRAVDVDPDAFAQDLLESLQLRLDSVGAILEAGKV